MDITLLVVDSDEDTLEICKEILSRFVKKVYIAKSQKESARYIKNFKIDILLYDLQLSATDDLAYLEDTKDSQDNIYTILITSFSNEFIKHKDDIASLGITRFLTKPFKIDILLNMVSEIDTLIKSKKYSQHLQNYSKTLENQIETNSKLIEDRDTLISSQSKYVLLGEMFSMTMHQLMQPIQAIKMLSSVLSFKAQRDSITNELIQDNTKQIAESCDFLSETIQGFKNFHKSKKSYDSISLEDVISDTIKLIKINIEKQNISLDIDIEQNMPELSTNKNELVQVILNLINNAKDALVMNKIDNAKIEVDSYYKNSKYYINISDNGIGVPQEIEHSIFEPNFTTKGKDGTGLGLYMSKMIVQNLGGDIRLQNSTSGATFVVTL
jgi:C4-dicarboxylate-specific signal transduction histidine kinase